MKKEEKRTQNNHGSQEKDIDSLLRSALKPAEEPGIGLKETIMKNAVGKGADSDWKNNDFISTRI